MTSRKRMLGIVAVAASLITALSGCAGTAATDASGQELEKVRFGYIGDFNGASLLAIADDQGFWAENGLDVQTSVFTNGPLQIQALGTGDLDFGYIGPGAMWLPASGQAKVVAINTLGNADRVIAQPGITSMADLKGKKVAVPEGTSGDMVLTLALKAAGMTKADVEVVPMDPSTVVAAFSSGQVDAAGIWYPLISTIKKQVPDLTELAKNADFADSVSFPTAFVSGMDLAADKPETVTKVLAALREAMDYRAANTDKAIELTATMLKLDKDDVAADAKNSEILTSAKLDGFTTDGTIDKWLSGMNDYFVGAGKLTAPVAPSTYYLGDEFVTAGK